LTTAPPEVQSLASARDFGQLLAVFRPAKRYGVFSGWLLLGLLPFAFLFGSAPVAALVLGSLFWPPAIRGLMVSAVVVRSIAGRRIYLYDKALVHASAAGELDCFRWDQITTLFQRVRTRRIGSKTFRRYRLIATRTDGKTIKLNQTWAEIAQLAQQTAGRVTRAQSTAARAALREGGSVRFGRLVVDAHGVTGPRGSAAWSEIEITISRWSMIAVLVADEFLPLFHARSWRIPNTQLLVQLYHGYRKPLP
jgi:hypothetical protein